MENGLNYMGVAFAMQLVQRYCIDEKHSQINEADFFNTIETLARIAAHSRQAPEGWVLQEGPSWVQLNKPVLGLGLLF